jgi:hypothetical protein
MAVLGKLPSGLGCRSIRETDTDGVVDCLCRGFPARDRRYWMRAFDRMSTRPAVGDLAKYGYLMEADGHVVGVVLTLYTRYRGPEGDQIRCNLSSWCVDDAYRPYAARLVATALKNRNVTYTNISPAPATRSANEALGFRRFSNGQFAFVPLLGPAHRAGAVVEYTDDREESAGLSGDERTLLSEHAALGCLSLICVRDGECVPFILLSRQIMNGLVRCHQVIYCRSTSELAEYAGPIGRFLLRRRSLLCLVDATDPVAGLRGRFFPDKGPKYFRGPRPPSCGDLTFTELVMFGS